MKGGRGVGGCLKGLFSRLSGGACPEKSRERGMEEGRKGVCREIERYDGR